jgi:hypothetical protein
MKDGFRMVLLEDQKERLIQMMTSKSALVSSLFSSSPMRLNEGRVGADAHREGLALTSAAG